LLLVLVVACVVVRSRKREERINSTIYLRMVNKARSHLSVSALAISAPSIRLSFRNPHKPSPPCRYSNTMKNNVPCRIRRLAAVILSFIPTLIEESAAAAAFAAPALPLQSNAQLSSVDCHTCIHANTNKSRDSIVSGENIDWMDDWKLRFGGVARYVC